MPPFQFIRRDTWLLCALAVLFALPLGEVAWAISCQNPSFAWPAWSHAQFLAGAAGLGLGWCWFNSLGWKLALYFDGKTGFRIGVLSLLPASLGLLWKQVLRFPLPPPHNFAARSLQILLAAQILLGLWLALGIGVAALWRSNQLRQWSPAKAALRLGGIAFLFFQLNGLWIGQWNMTGDAPHYLLMSHSLAYDFDLDLSNNYRHRDYRLFYDYDWELTIQSEPLASGQIVTEHRPGLSILLAPAYRLLKDSGAHWVLALMAAAGTGLFYALCLGLNFDPGQALLGWALFSFTAPWMTQSQNVMAEMLGALALLCSLSALRGVIPASTGWASIAFVYWVHVRYSAMGLILSLFTAFRRGAKGFRHVFLPLILVALSIYLSMLANKWLLGDASPINNRRVPLNELFRPTGFFYFMSGILFDQEFGFIPFAAIFALAPLGLIVLWKKDRLWFWQTVLPSLSYIGIIGSFPYWWSAMTPNRFMTCLVPVLALWTMETWRAWGSRPLFWGLAIYSWAWGMAMSILPWLSYSKTNGENWLLKMIGNHLHVNLPRYFPSFILGTPVSYFWLAGFAVAATFIWKRLGPPPR